MQQKITPNLWVDTEAEEAAGFYTSVFKSSRILSITHYTEAGPRAAGMVMTVEFELDGQRFVGINGGPSSPSTRPSLSRLPARPRTKSTTTGSGSPRAGRKGSAAGSRTGYGLSWQVVPTGMEEVLTDADPARAQRAMQAMLGMRKLDIAALRSAADGVSAT